MWTDILRPISFYRIIVTMIDIAHVTKGEVELFTWFSILVII